MSELRYVDLRLFRFKFEQFKLFSLVVIVVPYLVLACNYSCAEDDIIIISSITNTEISEFFLPVPESETTPDTGTVTVTDADTVEVKSSATEAVLIGGIVTAVVVTVIIVGVVLWCKKSGYQCGKKKVSIILLCFISGGGWRIHNCE